MINTNMNSKDHLVGQLTTLSPDSPGAKRAECQWKLESGDAAPDSPGAPN